MKKIFKSKQIHSYLSLVIFITLSEIAFRLICHNNIFSLSFLRSFLAINIFSLIIGYCTSFLKGKNITSIVNIIVVFLVDLYSWIQLGFNSYIGVYMSVNATSQLGAVTSYIQEFLKSIKLEYYLMYIPCIVLLITTIIFLKLKKKANKKFQLKTFFKYQNTIMLLSFLIMIIISGLGFGILLEDEYMDDKYQVVSNKDLFMTGSNPGLCIKEFGILPFGFIDLKAKFSGTTAEDIVYFAYNSNKETDVSRHIDDMNWNTLIEEETNETYNNLNNYYINNPITDKNECTGLFKDKNLIVIMMESVNDIIYNKEYFPNFSKLASEGWYFTNNYSPRNSCATGNNEFSAMTGLYSIYNNCTANVYLNNRYPNSIFNIFNDNNYYTNSLHDFTEGYYYRRTIHENMGSQKYYGVEDLGIEYSTIYGTWASDEDFMKKYLEVIDQTDKSNPFMSYLITVSSHQPYSKSSKFADMYLDITEDTEYSMEIRRYMSKLKVVDNALGILVDGLTERNLLDDTVIVLFGDHYPYGISLETLNEVLERDLNDYENEKVPLVIYNPELESTVNETYTSYVNLTPTLANLFGLSYDPRLYAGMDIFSGDYNNIVVFADSSWKNDKAYYNASTGTVTYYSEDTYTPEEIKNINTLIYSKMNASSLSIRYNYFDYLEKSLNEIKEREITE